VLRESFAATSPDEKLDEDLISRSRDQVLKKNQRLTTRSAPDCSRSTQVADEGARKKGPPERATPIEINRSALSHSV
jgi:hypothetical protein